MSIRLCCKDKKGPDDELKTIDHIVDNESMIYKNLFYKRITIELYNILKTSIDLT